MAQLVVADTSISGQILEQTYPHWNEGLSPSAYRAWWTAQTRTRWGHTGLRRYALVENGDPVTSAKLYDLTAVIDGRRVRVAGLGALFTPEPLRGRGLARDLVDAMLSALEREGFELALLFSEIGPAYYERLGFRTVPVTEVGWRVTTKPGAPATLVRGGDDRDLPAIVELGRVRAAPFRWQLDRSAEHIQFAIAKKRLLAGLGPSGARECGFYVTEEGHTAVGYVVMSVKDHVWTIEECGDRDPTGARVGAMLQVLLAREPSLRPPVIRGWMPPGFCPPQVTVVSEHPASEVMMVRGLGGYEPPDLPRETVLAWHGDMI